VHVPQLVGCVPSGPSLLYSGPSNVREVALAFDDGPWGDPPTIDFLKVLEREHAVATFFEIGEQIPTFDPTGAVQRRMLADGDMIGDHTWTHPDMVTLSAAAQTSQLEQTADAIRHATGFTPCLWRPPYGDQDSSLVGLARSLGMLTIMWDDDPRDWALPGAGAIYDVAVSEARNGAILEEHFGGGPRNETLEALPREIDTLRARGYKFVTVAQMLGLQLIYK
jgi:peptidoglycan-N-acetylglucosamine deacetylase